MRGFDPGENTYQAPPADGSSVNVDVSPKSDRIQLPTPLDKGIGSDLTEMRFHIKLEGKCTTDHSSKEMNMVNKTDQLNFLNISYSRLRTRRLELILEFPIWPGSTEMPVLTGSSLVMRTTERSLPVPTLLWSQSSWEEDPSLSSPFQGMQ